MLNSTTASEKAYETRVFRAAREISARIAELENPTTAQILEVMKNHKCSKRVLGDTFQVLDNQPYRFANHQIWHPRLRGLRNDTELGERMFALFK